MRKILMVAPTSFFSDYGGHIRILEETLALEAIHNRITIVTYYKGRDLPGIDIRRTAPLPYRTEYEVGSSRHKLVFDIYLALKTLRVALRERPDLIHAHMHEGALIGWVVSRLLGVPLVFDFQGSLTAEMIDHNFLKEGGVVHRTIRRVERFINHRAQVILTSSRQARRGLREIFQVPAERIEPLPDCVDLSRFDAGRFSEMEKTRVKVELGIPLDRPLVVYLGLLTDYQGIPDLIEAAFHLKQAGHAIHFLVMGFPNVAYYKDLAEGYGVSDCVTFTGKLPYDLAPLYLSAGDIAITAKVSATEGSGKLLNYMALGLPVVAYDTPVHREYLGEAGVYVPPKEMASLVAAIEGLAADPRERRRRGYLLRERVTELFTWQTAARQIDRVYAELLSGFKPEKEERPYTVLE